MILDDISGYLNPPRSSELAGDILEALAYGLGFYSVGEYVSAFPIEREKIFERRLKKGNTNVSHD